MSTTTPGASSQPAAPLNDLILRAARGEKTERAPVWVMRQAGRYLPEFREVRKDHDFFEICRNPELASEITMQPIRRYSGLLDAAIIFSDILVIPQALGMIVEMRPGPHFPEPLNEPSDLKKLTENVDVKKELGYVFDAIRLTKKKLNGKVPLIGFCGAPWTLMAYMIQGGSGSETKFAKARNWLSKYPQESKDLLQKITDVSIEYLVGQVHAGAQKIAVGVRAALPESSRVPMIGFAKGALGHSMAEVVASGYDVIGLDWDTDPRVARKATEDYSSYPLGHRIALQGNMNPDVLLQDRDAIEKTVKEMCRNRFGGSGAYIANLGHGITPGVDPENMRFFLECIHKYSREAVHL
ncbi:hypothetical protein CBS101457_005333 [Exobasidium rhododendri]|nr:hypothetical protein CBS101457_005333 [Exobasidium rhododendri]